MKDLPFNVDPSGDPRSPDLRTKFCFLRDLYADYLTGVVTKKEFTARIQRIAERDRKFFSIWLLQKITLQLPSQEPKTELLESITSIRKPLRPTDIMKRFHDGFKF